MAIHMRINCTYMNKLYILQFAPFFIKKNKID
jgi:hypothetical protein